MHSTLRFVLASLLVPAVVLLGENASLAQYAPAAPPPGYGPPPGQPMPAYSPTPYQPAAIAYPGYHEHDGFYMRLGLGGGYFGASASPFGQKMTFSGGAVTVSAAFGGTVAPNLIVYGEFSGMYVTDPEVSYAGATWTERNLTLSTGMMGPGVAYYLQPANVYFSGTIGFGKFQQSNSETDETLGSSKMGYGFSTMVGKEWWVSPDWGLGIAAQFQLMTAIARIYPPNSFVGDETRLTGYGASLMFSATYN